MLSVALSWKDDGSDEQALPRMRLDGIAPNLRSMTKMLSQLGLPNNYAA